MNKLNELKKKYEELGKEIEKLEKEESQKVGFQNDPIFLLSVEEYEKYMKKIPQINCWWWLRSPGYYSYSAAGVYLDGSVYDCGLSVYSSNNAVRPALKPFSGLDGRERIIYCGVTWIKIDKNLYIAEVPIMFNKFGEDNNDYETSEVREKLIKWYNERQHWCTLK